MKTKILSILLLCSGCQHTFLPGSKTNNINFSASVDRNCTLIEKETFSRLVFPGREEALKKQIAESANTLGATDVVATTSGINNSVKYYTCQDPKEVPEQTLRHSCNNEIQTSCVELVRRAVIHQNIRELVSLSEKSCSLKNNESCIWLDTFRQWRKSLQAQCISRNQSACLVGAVMADFDSDNILMTTLLKQGCSYGHSESCFYYNLELEIREKVGSNTSSKEQASIIAYRDYVKKQSRFMQEITNLLTNKKIEI